MTALAELMTAREFGELVSGNCPRCGGGQGCACTHCQTCLRPYAQCTCGPSDVLSPLPDDVVTEPLPWSRVFARVTTGAVLLAWAYGVAAYAFLEFRGS